AIRYPRSSSDWSDTRSECRAGSPNTASGADARCAECDDASDSVPSCTDCLGGCHRNQLSLGGELGLVEARINAVASKQLVMFAGLDDAAAIEHADHVGADDRRQAVGNDDGRAPLHQ